MPLWPSNSLPRVPQVFNCSLRSSAPHSAPEPLASSHLGLPASPAPLFRTLRFLSAPFHPIRLRFPPEPHSSAVSPPVPCPGLPHPRDPQGLTCYSATPGRASHSRPAPPTSRPPPPRAPRRRIPPAGGWGRASAAPWRPRGPFITGGEELRSTQRVAQRGGPHPGFWSKTRDHWRIASLLEPCVVGQMRKAIPTSQRPDIKQHVLWDSW